MATLETPKSILVRTMVPWITDSSWKQVKEYSPTFLTEFVVMASQILLYKLAAHYLGKTGFSEYALARRTVSLLFPILVLGMAVGLPRYIGVTNGRGGHRRRSSLFRGHALVCCSCGIHLFDAGKFVLKAFLLRLFLAAIPTVIWHFL